MHIQGSIYCTAPTACAACQPLTFRVVHSAPGRKGGVRSTVRGRWRWFSGLGVGLPQAGRCGLTMVAGNIAKGRNGSLGVGLDHVIDVLFQGVVDGDEQMDVVGPKTHLHLVMLPCSAIKERGREVGRSQ